MWHRLNPRFDGAFLNYLHPNNPHPRRSLNPRFDGAFLNYNTLTDAAKQAVLIPDLMGLF